MNILCDAIPDALSIAGNVYEINTHFSVWIAFEEIISNTNDESENILLKVKQLIFKSILPPPTADDETVDKILWFYRCGNDDEIKGSSSSKEIFSYNYDSGYIYAAFMQQYHIDLNKVNNLHWWKFHSLMLSLNDSTEFVKIMGYRAIEINSKMTSEQKAFYQKMKKHYKLPVKKEIQDKYNAIEEALINGEPIDKLL